MGQVSGGKAMRVVVGGLVLLALFLTFAIRHWMLYARAGGTGDLVIGALCSVAVVVWLLLAIRMMF